MKRVFISCTMALLVTCIFFTNVFAASASGAKTSVTLKGKQYAPTSQQQGGEIYSVVNGKAQKISQQQYLQLDQQSKAARQKVQTIAAQTPATSHVVMSAPLQHPFSVSPICKKDPDYPYVDTTFTKQSEATFLGNEQQVSAIMTGSGPYSYIQKSSYVSLIETWSVGGGITVTAPNDIAAFKIGVDHTWYTESFSTITINLGVPDGRQAYAVFRPNMYTATGIVQEDKYDEVNCQIVHTVRTYPMTGTSALNSPLDGILYVVYLGNLAANSSFESDLSGWGDWHLDGQASAQKVDGDWPYSGFKKLTHWAPFGYSQTTYQVVTDVPPGTYHVLVHVRSGGGQSHVRLEVNQFANGNEGLTWSMDINGTPVSDWGTLSVANIPITNRRISIGLHSDASAGQWAAWDNVELVRDGQ